MIQIAGEDFFFFLDNRLGGGALLKSGMKKKFSKCFSYFMWLFLHLACFSVSELPVDDTPVLLLNHILKMTPSVIAAKDRIKERKKERKQ